MLSCKCPVPFRRCVDTDAVSQPLTNGLLHPSWTDCCVVEQLIIRLSDALCGGGLTIKLVQKCSWAYACTLAMFANSRYHWLSCHVSQPDFSSSQTWAGDVKS